MEDKRFDEPVHVLLGPAGKIRVVDRAFQAADALLYEWPIEPTARHRSARQALVAFLEGVEDARSARKAFAAAAKDANILVPIDRVTPKR